MVNKDLKKANLFIISGFTGTFESLINIGANPLLRQILSPLSILLSFFFSTFLLWKFKCYGCDKPIANNEEEIIEYTDQLLLIESSGAKDDKTFYQEAIKKCKAEVSKLKRKK